MLFYRVIAPSRPAHSKTYDCVQFADAGWYIRFSLDKRAYKVTGRFDETPLKGRIRSACLDWTLLLARDFAFTSADDHFLRSILAPSLSRTHPGCSTGDARAVDDEDDHPPRRPSFFFATRERKRLARSCGKLPRRRGQNRPSGPTVGKSQATKMSCEPMQGGREGGKQGKDEHSRWL